MLHEMMHALGFEHEHQSPFNHPSDTNPDRALNYLYQNINPTSQIDLLPFSSAQGVRATGYDYLSIMHYHDQSFVRALAPRGTKTLEVSSAVRAGRGPAGIASRTWSGLSAQNALTASDITAFNAFYGAGCATVASHPARSTPAVRTFTVDGTTYTPTD